MYTPDFSKVNKDITNAAKFKENLNKVITISDSAFNDVRNEVATLRHIEAVALMSSMEIDKLSDVNKGIRISALKSAGIDYIGQIANKSELELTRIKGIGSENAALIRNAAESFEDSLSESISIKINIDEAQKYEKLIKALFSYIRSEKFAITSKNLLDEYSTQIDSAVSKIKIKSSLKWIFAFKASKMTTIEGCEELSRISSIGIFEQSKFISENVGKIKFCSNAEILDDFKKNAATYFTVLEKIDGAHMTSVTKDNFPKALADEINKIELNLGDFGASLRRYQEFGVKYAFAQKKVLLGDEMGLGKTMQAIALMCHLKMTLNATHFLVVCPASVLVNWDREIKNVCSINSMIIHGKTREEVASVWIEKGGIAITNYETVDELLECIGEGFRYDLLVVDEAHYVKNPSARRSIFLKQISVLTDRIMFMTGTPLENNIDEFCNLLGWLNKEVGESAKENSFMKDVPQFRTLIAPTYLRRNREDVLTELPQLTEKMQYLTMSDDDEKAYIEALKENEFMTIRRIGFLQASAKNSNKIKRLKEIADNARSEGRKIIVFSFYLDTLKKVAENMGDGVAGLIYGGISPDRRQEIVDDFSNSEKDYILLCQIQAGGVGLNIQAASIVVFCEPQLKPSIEEQAIARCYRMGQVRNVFAYRLVYEGTIEDHVLDILKQKADIFEAFANHSVMGAEDNKISNKKVIQDIIDKERQKYNLSIVNEGTEKEDSVLLTDDEDESIDALEEVAE